MTRPPPVAAVAAVVALLPGGPAAAQPQSPSATTPAAAAAPAAAVLVVTFSGLTSDAGAVMIALYDSEAAYTGGAPLRAVQVKAAVPQVTASFAGLAPGRYALKCFHDLDGDGKLGTNPFGMPTEPFAFSNNAPARLGPPTWAEAAFTVDAAGAAQSITIQ